jgi:hypothetical protein
VTNPHAAPRVGPAGRGREALARDLRQILDVLTASAEVVRERARQPIVIPD